MDRTNKIEFTAYVDIDWADEKHDICIQEANNEKREFSVIPHDVAAINEWANSLYKRFGGPIAVGVELSKGPLISVLQKHGF